MDTKKKLTKTAVDTLHANDKEVWIWDTDLPGFGVRCTPTGRKTYVARYRTKAGTQRKQVIARTCDMPPDKARDLARKVFQQVAEGADPMSERRLAKPSGTKTVEALFKAYVASMQAAGKASATEVERALLLAEKNNAADALGRTKPAADVTASDVVDYVASIYKAGHKGAADKHRGYVSAAFGWAVRSANDYTQEHRQDWGVRHNPVADVAKDPDAKKTRDRALSTAELKQLWQATRPGCSGFAPETSACIRVLIACGQRVRETLRLEGRELNFADRTWKMPAHKTKGREYPHTIPLPKAIIPDLRLLVSLHGSGPLFAGRAGDEIMHDSSILQAIERWREVSKIPHFTTRDIRRTWKSRAGDGAKISKEDRDLIQQHARNDTGSVHYDRADYLPQMQEAMDKWGDWITINLEDKPDLHLVA